MRALLVSLILTAIAGPATAAPFDQFLASAWSDHKVTLQAKSASSYSHASGLQLIEGLQVKLSRTEVMQNRSNIEDDFDQRPTRHLRVEQQEVSLRVRPRGFTQLRLLSSLGQGQRRLDTLAEKTAISKALFERYTAVVTYVYASEAKRIYGQLLTTQKNRIAMIRRLSQSGGTSVADILKQRSSVEKVELKLAEIEGQYASAVAALKMLDANFTKFDLKLDELVSPQKMLAKVGESTTNSDNVNSQYSLEISKHALDSIRYDIARDGRLIDYVEFGFRNDYEDRLLRNDNRFGISIGINVPGFSSSEFNRADKMREAVKYEIEAKDVERETTVQMQQAKDSLSLYSRLYQTINDSEDPRAASRLRNTAARHDPLLANALEADEFERQLTKIEVYGKAAESYLNYLLASGTLANRSHTNFLSRDLKEISL